MPNPVPPSEKSSGHIAFMPDTHRGFWEYFVVGGDVYRATSSAPVMPDGRRSGRWYCYATESRIAGIIAAALSLRS